MAPLSFLHRGPRWKVGGERLIFFVFTPSFWYQASLLERELPLIDLERRRAVRSIMSMRDFANYVIAGGINGGEGGGGWTGRREGWGEGKELPVLATWIHVLVSRSAEKRGLCGSINMRMTRNCAWFCAILDAHGCANKMCTSFWCASTDDES